MKGTGAEVVNPVPGLSVASEAARVEPDVTRRLELYAAAETTLLEAAPAVFLTHPLYAALVG